MTWRKITAILRVILGSVVAIVLCAGNSEEGASKLPNAFYAMNFHMLDQRYTSPEAQADVLKELGYDGAYYYAPLAGLENALRVFDERKLPVFTVGIPRVSDPIFVEPDGARYDPEIRKAIQLLKGRATLLIVTFRSKGYRPSDVAADPQVIALARELADYADSYGVRLAIYPHGTNLVERVEDALRIARKAGRKNLGICFPLYHWLKKDDRSKLETLAKAALPHLFQVTINGSSEDGSYENLGAGAYDVTGFMRVFHSLGYTGPVALQCVTIKGDPRENLGQSMMAWRRISATLSNEK